jgi:hypothetical protein
MVLDSVEKKLLRELAEVVPEYKDLELDILAHDQLKKRLFAIRTKVQELKIQQSKQEIAEFGLDLPTRLLVAANSIVNPISQCTQYVANQYVPLIQRGFR